MSSGKSSLNSAAMPDAPGRRSFLKQASLLLVGAQVSAILPLLSGSSRAAAMTRGSKSSGGDSVIADQLRAHVNHRNLRVWSGPAKVE